MSTVSLLFPADRPEDALVAALHALALETPSDLPEAVALERARVLLAQGEKLRVLGLRALADVERRQLHALEGAPTATSWVKAQQVAGLGARDVALARRLDRLPLVEQALLTGSVSLSAGALVGRAVDRARPFLDRPDGLIDGLDAERVLYGVLVDGVCSLLAEQTGGAPESDPDLEVVRAACEAIVEADRSQVERWEAGLVLFAERCASDLLRSGTELLLDALLPAEHDKRAARAEDEAGLDLHRKSAGSGWTIAGDLDDELGELLFTTLNAEQATDPEGPTDTAAWSSAGADPDLADLQPEMWPDAVARPRSKRARQHDALKAALARLLGSGLLGTRDKVRPHVAVVVQLDFLEGVPGALPGRSLSGGRLGRTQVRRLMCQSTFTRLVLDAGRKVVEASHTARTATALERLINHVQWGGRCAGAGCARGPTTGHRLVPHHGDLFSRTGTTSLEDTIPLCEPEHHLLHAERRVITLRDGRQIGPDGWVRPQRR